MEDELKVMPESESIPEPNLQAESAPEMQGDEKPTEVKEEDEAKTKRAKTERKVTKAKAEEDEAKTPAAPKTAKQEDYTVKYIGKAASYTIGTVRFEPGQTKEIAPAYVDTALSSGQFEEV